MLMTGAAFTAVDAVFAAPEATFAAGRCGAFIKRPKKALFSISFSIRMTYFLVDFLCVAVSYLQSDRLASFEIAYLSFRLFL